MSTSSQLSLEPDFFNRWERRLASLCEELDAPGLNAAVLVGHEVVWRYACGLARVKTHEDLTTQHAHRIGSITKLFTAHVIMQLRDEGLLDLGDPVSLHLPEFNGEGADQVTIRHLLCHGGGIPSNAGLDVWQTGRFPTRDEFRAMLGDLTPVVPLMRNAKYSNAGVSMLGLVIDAVDRTPYEESVRSRVLVPLEMERTSFLMAEDADGPFAPGHVRRPYSSDYSEAPDHDLKSWNACGMLLSTPSDLLKLARLQWADSTLLPRPTRNEMHKLQLFDSYEGDWLVGYGLGWRLQRFGEYVFAGHGGGYVGNHCQVDLSLRHQTAVAVFANGNHAVGIPELTRELLASIVEENLLPFGDTKAREVMPRGFGSIIGNYFAELWHGAQIRWARGLELVAEESGSHPISLASVDDGRFRITEGRDAGEDLEILSYGANGLALRIRIAGMVYERV